jgi:hypothetical protein
MKFVLGHVLAGAALIVGTLSVTFMCYIVGLTKSSDSFDTPAAEIPLFLYLMFMAGIFAVIASTSSFLISVLLTWVRMKRHFPAWLPVVIVPLLTFVVVVLIFGRTKDMAFVALVTGLAFLYFGIYWTLLLSSAAVLDFVRHRFSRPKTL